MKDLDEDQFLETVILARVFLFKDHQQLLFISDVLFNILIVEVLTLLFISKCCPFVP